MTRAAANWLLVLLAVASANAAVATSPRAGSDQLVSRVPPGQNGFEYRCRSCEAPEYKSEYEGFRESQRAGDWDAADAAIRRLPADAGSALLRADFFLYDRGDCEAARDAVNQLPADGMTYDDLRFDSSICRASRLEVIDPAAAEEVLSAALDGDGDLLHSARNSFERFARRRGLDVRSLRFLKSKGMDRWWHDYAGVGIERQVDQLRPDNVEALLSLGVDANEPIRPDSELLLQIARSASLKNEAAALSVARVLIDHGADPNMLGWYRNPKDGTLGQPGSPAMESLLRSTAAGLDPIRIDFLDVVQVSDGERSHDTMRIRIGNSSGSQLPVDAWVAGKNHYCSIHTIDYEFRPLNSSKWKRPVAVVEDGTSSGTVELAPGQSMELFCNFTFVGPPGSEYRFIVRTGDGVERHSTPFRLDEFNYQARKSFTTPGFKDWR